MLAQLLQCSEEHYWHTNYMSPTLVQEVLTVLGGPAYKNEHMTAVFIDEMHINVLLDLMY